MTRRSSVFLVVVLATSCTLLFDGSDLRGRRDGGGVDAPGVDAFIPCGPSCAMGLCCVGGGCVPIDNDQDGYARPECTGAGVPDCDDDDPATFPWPPKAPLSYRYHEIHSGIEQLRVVAQSSTCAILTFLGDPAPQNVVLDRVGDSSTSCGPVITLAPTAISCATGDVFDSISAVDLRHDGSIDSLTLGGKCTSGVDAISVTQLSLSPTLIRGETSMGDAVEVELVTAPTPPGVVYRSSDGHLQLTRGGTVSPLAFPSSQGVQVSGGLAIFRASSSIGIADLLDASSQLRDIVGLQGRGTLVYAASSDRYAALFPSSTAGSTQLSASGPFSDPATYALAPIISATWSSGTVSPHLDAAIVDSDLFVVAGGTSTNDVRVILGRLQDPVAFEPGELRLAVPSAVDDVAVAVAPREADRVAIFVAATDTRAHSVRFSVCLP